MDNGTYIWKIKVIGNRFDYTYIGIDNADGHNKHTNLILIYVVKISNYQIIINKLLEDQDGIHVMEKK